MKKKHKLTALLLILLLISVLAFYLSKDNEITYTEPEWDCEMVINKWECNISFEIKNRTYDRITRKMSIRGLRIPSNSKHSSLKLCGEKVLNIDLEPNVTVQIKEKVLMDRKPSKININIWK